MRASGVAARRILVKAATLSPKNIVPKAEVSKSYSSSAAVAGSTCRQSTLVRPPPPAADIHHPLAGAWSSKAEQGVRHRCERDVGVLLPSHPGVAALAVPEGKHGGVNLFGGGPAWPHLERGP